MIKKFVSGIWNYLYEKRIIDFIILFGIIGFVYQGWFKPGSIAHIDLFSPSKLWLMDHLSGPFAWFDEHYGFSGGVWTLAEYPVYAAWAVLVKLFNLDIDLARRVVWCYTFLVLSIFSIYYLSYTLFKNRVACFISVLLFNLNNIFMIYLGGGYLMGGTGTSFTALVLALFIKGLRDNSLKHSLLAGFLLGINTYYDMKFTILCSVILLMFFVYNSFFGIKQNYSYGIRKSNEIFQTMQENARHPVVLFSVTCLLNLFWILPIFLGEGVIFPSGSEQSAYVNASFSNTWFHAIILSLKNRAEMGHIFVPSLFFITVLVYFSIFFRPKNYYVVFLFICALIFAFLSKGAAAPFGFVFYWLFNNIPGFVGFRACEKFLFPQLIFYSLLLGFTVCNLILKNRVFINLMLISLVIIVILASISMPFFGKDPYLMNKHSTLNPKPMPEENKLLYKLVEIGPENYRNFIFPDKSCFIIHDMKHPAIYPVLYSQGYYRDFTNYFLVNRGGSKSIFNREKADCFGKIFGLLSVRNVMVLPQSEDMWGIAGNNTISSVTEIMDRQKGFRKIILGKNKNNYDNVLVYRNSNPVPLIYVPSKTALVIGSRNILFKLAPYIDFSEWGFFFTSQLKDKALSILPYIDLVIFNEKETDDFVLNTLENKYHIDLWQYAKYATAEIPTEQRHYGSWYKEENFWIRYYRQYFTSHVGEIPECSGIIEAGAPSIRLSIPWYADESKEYDVWLRIGVGNDLEQFREIGGVSFLIDYSFMHYFSSYSENQTGLKWVKLGKFLIKKGEHIVNIENRKGINSLDDLVIVPSEVLKEHSNRMASLLSAKEIVQIGKTGENIKNILKLRNFNNLGHHPASLGTRKGQSQLLTQLFWEKINPTKYRIKIKNNKPVFIVFNSNYHPLWKVIPNDNRNSNMKKTESIIINSFANSFLLHEGGVSELELKYSSQVYVRTGFVLSAIFGFVIIIFLIIVFKPVRILKNIFIYFANLKSLSASEKTGYSQVVLSKGMRVTVFISFICYFVYMIVYLFYFLPEFRHKVKLTLMEIFGLSGLSVNLDRISIIFKDKFLIGILILFFIFLGYMIYKRKDE